MKQLKCLLIFIIIFLVNIKVNALDLSSKYAVLYNLTDNEIIYEKEKDKQISIASLTKIMTSIIAIEKIDNINDKVTFPYGVNEGLLAQNAARVGFIEGSTVTYNDLLYGSLLPSGADATRALAILISGSENDYVKLMNEKTKQIGMMNTQFMNVSGFDEEGHYSTVEDVLKLLKYALQNSKFKKIYESKNYTTSDSSIYMKSTIVGPSKSFNVDVSNIKGSKTGFTNAAGYCLASEFIINDTVFLSVTAKADSDGKPNHIIDASKMYEYIKNNYHNEQVVKTNTLALTLKPEYSKENKISFYTNKSISKLIKNNEKSNIEYIYNGKEYLFGNEKRGMHLGTVDIVYKNKVIDTIDIILNKDLTFDYFKYLKQYIVIIPIIVIIVVTLLFVKHKKRLKNS